MEPPRWRSGRFQLERIAPVGGWGWGDSLHPPVEDRGDSPHDEDLQPEQHAYRSGHDAHGAIAAVQGWLDRGFTEVVDADLSGYFDTIPHHELMKCVARRISDRHLLHLVKMWLEAAVEETDEKGRKVRTTRNKDEGRDTPQGGVASPL